MLDISQFVTAWPRADPPLRPAHHAVLVPGRKRHPPRPPIDVSPPSAHPRSPPSRSDVNSTSLDTAALDRALGELRASARSWADALLAERIGLLERLLPR